MNLFKPVMSALLATALIGPAALAKGRPLANKAPTSHIKVAKGGSATSPAAVAPGGKTRKSLRKTKSSAKSNGKKSGLASHKVRRHRTKKVAKSRKRNGRSAGRMTVMN